MKIKYADEIVKEIENQGKVQIPNGCVNGDAFEEWLMGENNMETKDKPNKVKAKLIVEIEGEFYDDEASEETLRSCVEQDLEDSGFDVIDVSVI